MFATMYDILTVSGSVVAGIVLGFVFVGTFVYKTNKYDDVNDSDSSSASGNSSDDDNSVDDDDYEQHNIEIREFQDSGFDTLSDMKSYPIIKEKFDHLKTSFIEIETPEGLCKMNYDDSVESFTYYCDNKSISYKTLDAVARQFAIKYNCKQICVNYKEEYEKAKLRLEKKENDAEKQCADADAEKQCAEKPKKVEEQRSPFAKLKNYKTIDQSSVPSAKVNNSKTENKQNKQNEEQAVLVINKANKFKFRGFIKDFVDPNAVPVVDNSVKKIDYNSFKKMMENKTTTTM